MVKSMFLAFCGNGWVSPSEFWNMAPGELWWMIEAKTPKGTAPDDLEEMYQALRDAQEAELLEVDEWRT
jgi:hypothetical protein